MKHFREALQFAISSKGEREREREKKERRHHNLHTTLHTESSPSQSRLRPFDQ